MLSTIQPLQTQHITQAQPAQGASSAAADFQAMLAASFGPGTSRVSGNPIMKISPPAGTSGSGPSSSIGPVNPPATGNSTSGLGGALQIMQVDPSMLAAAGLVS